MMNKYQSTESSACGTSRCVGNWRSIIRIVACAIFIFGFSSCSVRHEGKSPQELNFGLRGSSYRPKAPETWSLPNGMTVMFVQDNELPLIQGVLYIKGGGLWEADAVLGATSAMGDQMRQGGAGTLDADELDAELERLAAGIGSNFAGENGRISFSCLESDFDRVFSIFGDVIRRPRFNQSRLDLLKGQSLDSIRRRVEDPSTVAQLAFSQLLYGDSPFGRVVVDTNVRRLTREDLVRMHELLVRPKDSVLVITGNISRERARQAVEAVFSDWQSEDYKLPALSADFSSAAPGIYFVDLPFEQSTVLLGHLGVPRFSPDYIAIDAFNDIFGSSGFGSRLMTRVRTQLGLAYSVFGMVQAGYIRGKNLIMLQTKAESTGQALKEAIDVVRDVQKDGVTQAELAESQRAIVNSFVFRFDSTDEAAQRAALFRVLDYPEDYDRMYVERIQSLSPAQVDEVARKRWDISKFVIVVVGNDTAYTSLKALTDEGGALFGTPLTRVKFDQKLQWP